MSASSHGVDLQTLRREAESLLADAPAGEPLSIKTRALVEYAVCMSVTSLDLAAARPHAERALDAGATAAQLHEVLVLVSGLGAHTLMEGSRALADLVLSRGGELPPLDTSRKELRDRRLGATAFWSGFEHHVPGFLDAILRLSPEGFEGFVSYGAIPAQTRTLRAVTKEVISVAVDATPYHRYLPGLRLHLDNAVKLGAGRMELFETLDLAAAAPPHRGVA